MYVSGIIQGGVADRSGMLAVGDRIISVRKTCFKIIER